MTLLEFFTLGVALSMDAFAVSVCKGLNMPKINARQTLLIGLFFGGFQGLMPVIGYLLGARFERYITGFDHWIAFALLAFLGGKMLLDALKKSDGDCSAAPFSIKELLLMAVATSIDALAVGITFAFLRARVALGASIIAVTTFVISIAGVFIGHRFGARWEKPAQIVGGAILILIGLKILLEHLGVISF